MAQGSSEERKAATIAMRRAMRELSQVTDRHAVGWQRGDPDAMEAMDVAMRRVDEARYDYDIAHGEIPTVAPVDAGPPPEAAPGALPWPPRWPEVAQLIEDSVIGGDEVDGGASRPFIDFNPYTAPWTQENVTDHGVLAAFASGKAGRLVPIGSDASDSVIALYRSNEAIALHEATVIYLSSEGGDPAVVAADLDDFIVLVSLGWSPFGLTEAVAAGTSDGMPMPQPVGELRTYVSAHLASRDRSLKELLSAAQTKRGDLPH